jgi:arsenite transporter
MGKMFIMEITMQIRRNLGICSFAAFAAGILIGNLHSLPSIRLLLPLACALMLFPAFLEINRKKLVDVAARPLPFLISLFFNILVSPLLMYGLTVLLTAKSITGLTVGLLIFGMIPAGGMGPAYTGMLNGNVNLSVTISAVSLFLSMGSIPFWSLVLIGKVVPVRIFLIAKYLFLIIILPMLLAALVRHWVVGRRGEATFADMKGFLQNISVMGLLLMLFIIAATNAPFLSHSPHFILEMILPAISFSLLLLITATLAGLAFRLPYADRVALTIGATTKNTAIAMALAVTAFSGTEALSIAIAGPLVQLPVMLCYLNVLTRFPGWNKKIAKNEI